MSTDTKTIRDVLDMLEQFNLLPDGSPEYRAGWAACASAIVTEMYQRYLFNSNVSAQTHD